MVACAWVAGVNESKQSKELRRIRDEVLQECVDGQAKMHTPPVFCRMTALALLAIERPRMRGRREMRLERVIATANEHHGLAGIRDVRWAGVIQTHIVEDAVCCTSPECTWVMMARVLSSAELVVLADSMMRRDPQLKRTSVERLETYLDRLGECPSKVWGLRACRSALRLVRENTDSSMESRVRLVLESYGLGAPEVNHPVVNPHTGRFMYLDMAYVDLKIAIEYDGQFHADQWEADVHRRRLLDELGWDVVQVTAADMRTEGDRHALALRVAQHISLRLGRKVRVRPPLSVKQLMDGRRSVEARWALAS